MATCNDSKAGCACTPPNVLIEGDTIQILKNAQGSMAILRSLTTCGNPTEEEQEGQGHMCRAIADTLKHPITEFEEVAHA